MQLLSSSEAPPVCTNFEEWLHVWRSARAEFGAQDPFSAMVYSCHRADRMAWLFFSAYQAALQCAFGIRVTGDSVASLCVTEAERPLQDPLTEVRQFGGYFCLDGLKTWSVRCVKPFDLYVLCRWAESKPRVPGSLALVRVRSNQAGVTFAEATRHKVIPELAHYRVQFDGVVVPRQCVLEGDAYIRYIKPFRVREELFVRGACVTYFIARALRSGWPTELAQDGVSVLYLLRELSHGDPTSASTQVAAAGAIEASDRFISRAAENWRSLQPNHPSLAMWKRDEPLLAHGADVRRKRIANAWQALRPDTQPVG